MVRAVRREAEAAVAAALADATNEKLAAVAAAMAAAEQDFVRARRLEPLDLGKIGRVCACNCVAGEPTANACRAATRKR